jgi:hypothetical protein
MEEEAVDEFSLTEVPDDWEEHEDVVEEGPEKVPPPVAYLRLDRRTRGMRGAITCPACKKRVDVVNPHALRDHHQLCLGTGHRPKQPTTARVSYLRSRVQKKKNTLRPNPGNGEHWVAEIKDHTLRGGDGNLWFLVRWEDPTQKSSWQPLADFVDWDEQGNVKLIDGHVRSYVRRDCPELEHFLLKKQV